MFLIHLRVALVPLTVTLVASIREVEEKHQIEFRNHLHCNEYKEWQEVRR